MNIYSSIYICSVLSVIPPVKLHILIAFCLFTEVILSFHYVYYHVRSINFWIIHGFLYTILWVTQFSLWVEYRDKNTERKQILSIFKFANVSYFNRLDRTKDVCAICLDSLGYTKDVVKMPNCIHVFHEDCAIESYKYNMRCPLCRG